MPLRETVSVILLVFYLPLLLELYLGRSYVMRCLLDIYSDRIEEGGYEPRRSEINPWRTRREYLF